MKIPTFNFNIYTILVWTNLYPDHFSSAEYSPGLIFTLDAFSERGFVPFFTIIVADIRGSKLRYFFYFSPNYFLLIFLCSQDIRPNSSQFSFLIIATPAPVTLDTYWLQWKLLLVAISHLIAANHFLPRSLSPKRETGYLFMGSFPRKSPTFHIHILQKAKKGFWKVWIGGVNI